MEGFLRAETGVNLPHTLSPTNSFVEVASICPLITPSPPTNDLINPEPELAEPNYTIGDQLVTRLRDVQDEDKGAEDSASSSSSALAEPACAQLLNHRSSVYHHIVKDEQSVSEETAGKVQTMQLTFRNPPENYFFMSWNWPVIRKVLLGFFLSALGAMLTLVIAMIWALPKTCNPYTEWYEGKVFYEVFPASFCDSNSDMIGDFKGMYQEPCLNYTKALGVKAVRLNYIFKTPHYPEDYKNVTTLVEIAPQLGDIGDLKKLARKLHKNDIMLLLDLPIFPVVKQLLPNRKPNLFNETHAEPVVEFLKTEPKDLVEEALLHWISGGIDGFYLKGLEYFIDDINLVPALRRWRKIIGPERIFIVSENLINGVPPQTQNILFNNVNLVDVHLHVERGISAVTKQIESLLNSTLFLQKGKPWIHWNIGDDSTKRLANILPYSNATFGATLLQLMLPGTPSIFYGNEVGLQQISDLEGEHRDLQHLHQLAFMTFKDTSKKVLPWMPAEDKKYNFRDSTAVANMIELRDKSPAIYMNSIYKQGDNRANAEIKYSRSELLVIQRWYPRRKIHVVVSNLGNVTVGADLSSLLYSGVVKIGPRTDSKSESISFKDISLCPGESVVIQLD